MWKRLRINELKTKYLRASRRGAECDQNEPLKVYELIFQRTEQFPYLGVTMTDHNKCMEDNEISTTKVKFSK